MPGLASQDHVWLMEEIADGQIPPVPGAGYSLKSTGPLRFPHNPECSLVDIFALFL
jgi:hypothetical protein